MFFYNRVVSRYDEHAKMVHDLNSVLQTIQDRLKECQQWDIQHQVLVIFGKDNLIFVLGLE
jgi:DNA modification methylase